MPIAKMHLLKRRAAAMTGLLFIFGALLSVDAFAYEFCSAAGGGPGTVTLTSVPTSRFGGAGSVVYGVGYFNIFDICSGTNSTWSSYMYLQSGSVDSSTNNLTNTGTAQNVELQIVETDNNQQILLSKGVGQQNEYHSTSKDGIFGYQVNYYATGNPTPGTISASLQFTAEYP